MGRFLFSGVFLHAVIASPLGRGNPVGVVMRDARAMRELHYASAGLPRQADAFLAMTKVKRVRRNGTLPVFGRIPPRCHCEPVKGVAIQSGS